MAIITSRTNETGKISINYELCSGCGLCEKVCKDFSIEMLYGKPVVSEHPLFGCISCGHCMAVCPEEAISISGREMSEADRIALPAANAKPEYAELLNLMIGRRSIRDFKDMDIEDELIEKILKASLSAPMGIPPSDVSVVVFRGKDKVREFSFDVIDYFKKVSWIFSGAMMPIWRLAGKETYQVMKSFGQPLVSFMTKSKEEGMNYLLYDAPLAIYFLASMYSDPADPYIPATYATLAAESLGLGSCMIGSIQPIIQYGAKRLKRKWNLPVKSPAGIFVIFGYPKYKFHSGLRRSFSSINYA
jgi:Pyruvate/2-oxoacid:ferredoxin oxidoreductase delta subunit/nitroreductase